MLFLTCVTCLIAAQKQTQRAFGSHLCLLHAKMACLAIFTQQLDLNYYIGDLIKYLKKLASSSSVSNNSKKKNSKLLTVSERPR